MNESIGNALKSDTLCDITTQGRLTGNPHKIEIAFHDIDGEVYISGMPGKRDWYANVVANPEMTFHLKQSIRLDIPADAVPILDPEDRRQLLTQIVMKWNRVDDLDSFVEGSPLIRVDLKLN